MAQAGYTFAPQSVKMLLDQVQTNLRDAREIQTAQEIVGRWRDRIASGRASYLVGVLNHQLGERSIHRFTEHDFEGAILYPHEEREVTYAAKHTLPPISFGLHIPQEKWRGMQRKLGLEERCRRVDISERVFSRNSFGLDTVGLVFHKGGEDAGFEEADILQRDISLYSRSFSDLEGLIVQKLANPPMLAMALLCKTHKTLSAGRYEPGGKEKMPLYLAAQLGMYWEKYARCLERNKVDRPSIEQIKMTYTIVAATITTDIARYVDAAYTLEETIGPQVLTPLMFALGRKVEVRNIYVLESPVAGVIKAREYLESGELRVEDITQILERKGYRQMGFA